MGIQFQLHRFRRRSLPLEFSLNFSDLEIPLEYNQLEQHDFRFWF